MNSKRNNLSDKIKNAYTFKDLDIGEINHIVSLCYFKKFFKGQFVYMEMGPIDSLYIIYKGTVELYKITDRYTKKIYATLYQGEDFGIPELFNTDNLHLLNAQCIEDCEIAIISKNDFFKIILNNNHILRSLLYSFGYMINQLHKDMTIEKRSIKFLTFLSIFIKGKGLYENGILYIPKLYSDGKIADILNLARETVNRSFKKLEDLNIIKIEKDRIIILDREYIDKNAVSDTMIGVKGLIIE